MCERLQPNRPANRCRCLIVCARKGEYNGGTVGSTRAFLEAARASRKPAGKKLWRMEEEKCPVSVRQHFVLYNARSLSYSASVYSFKEGAVSLINYPPNKSNYLGSLLYLILYYIHQRARTREGPVPTLYTPIALGDSFLHDIRPHLTAQPPVCAKIGF